MTRQTNKLFFITVEVIISPHLDSYFHLLYIAGASVVLIADSKIIVSVAFFTKYSQCFKTTYEYSICFVV